jgi:ABC-type Mn2+/Zn2+ transport system ATPase subunit
MMQPKVSPKQTGVSHDPSAPALACVNLTHRYATQTILDEVNFQLTQGEQVALVGPNGAGKSTLLKIIAGLMHPTSGKVHIYGSQPDDHICIAYVPQRSNVDWSFPVNVYDVVMMGRTSRIGLLRRPSRHDHAVVRECMEMVAIAPLAQRQIGELSGGQQQRVFIARAIAQEAQLMLLDEPFTGLDVSSQSDILAILRQLREKHVTIMVSTHDLNQAAEHFDRVMLLKEQLLGIGTAGEVFTQENLNKAYGGHLHTLGTQQTVLVDTCCEGGDNRESLHV